MSRAFALALLAASVLIASTATGAPASAATDPLVAPVTTLSPDGRTATDSVRTLSVSVSQGLDPAGQTVTVSGSGYDTFKGIYLAFCVIPPTNQPPTPCGGGADQTGASGASQWISSNPPPQGVGLAVPYGPGGSFATSISVSASVNASIDCRRVRCAVVTRNDHVRTTDRSQDIFVPVSFASEAADPGIVFPTGPEPTAAPTTPAPTTTTEAPTTTTAPTTTSEVPDASVLGAELSASDEADAEAAAGAPSSDDGTSPLLPIGAVVALIGAAAGTGVVLARRRRVATP